MQMRDELCGFGFDALSLVHRGKGFGVGLKACLGFALVGGMGGMGGMAFAQPSVAVDLSGVSIPSLSTSPADVVRNSGSSTVDAAPGYLYTFNPTIRGTGLLGGLLIPSARPLGDVLNSFVPGQYRVVTGAMRNPGGQRPCQVFFNAVGGTFSGLTLSLSLDLSVLSTGVGQAAVRNITKPVGVGLQITTGGATITAWTPPPALRSEWHFDGDLLSVKESGLAADAGPSKIRFLDDSRFGEILGGPGQETQIPSPPTPTGVTAQQSSFGTASSFGLPLPGGVDDVVYRTSPPVNLSDTGNRAKSRGIGLIMWPNTRDTWPDDKIGQWTMVWDLYIPSTTWASEYVMPLIESNHNNDGAADGFIRQVGGTGLIGYAVEPGQYTSVTAIGPDRWLRLALVSDGYRTGQSKIYVDGVFVGTTKGDWFYNSTKSQDPRFGDVSTAQPVGTVVPQSQWNSWGEFPSPWAIAPNANNAAPMASTVCLFSDLLGRGGSVFVANMMFSDEAMMDTEISGLGGVNGRGIVFLRPEDRCIADYNNDGGVDGSDIEAFFIDWEQGIENADVNQDGGVDGGDIESFFVAWEQGGC